MSTLQRATQTLTEAEAALRRMIGEAAERGDYSSVELITRWAIAVGELWQSNGTSLACSSQPHGIPPEGSQTTATAPSRPNVKESRGKRKSYPCFAKSGDVLFKIAWSKSSRSEYQHKSPRAVTLRLAEALARSGKNGMLVSMDKVLPLKLDGGTQVPDYQTYVSLAWFRHIGAVKQNGRQGYTVKKPNDLVSLIEAAWTELPEATSS